ncbi:DUF2188 domain-containing protein [Aeromicrobium sp.]|uniref:DUF2188 domain-containing protein n=1 Tax=Aeromicrobium sp. TaxID=1871063 RepID=UPI00344B73B6
MAKNVHVTPHDNGWQVVRAGADRASSVHPRSTLKLPDARQPNAKKSSSSSCLSP